MTMNRKQRRAQASKNRKNNNSVFSNKLNFVEGFTRTSNTRLTKRSSNRNITGFGAYYRGQTDHGMGVTLTTMSGIPQEMLNDLFDHVIEAGNMFLETFDSNVRNGADPADQKRQIVAMMKENTANFNNHAYNRTDGQQPDASYGTHKHEITPEWLNLFAQCAVTSAVLVCLGVIQDDDQNGLHTMQTCIDLEKEFA